LGRNGKSSVEVPRLIQILDFKTRLTFLSKIDPSVKNICPSVGYTMICRYPFPAAEKHDKTVFCGGTNKQPREQWDRNSLYHHIPKGKKALGDSAYEGVPEKVTVKRAGQDKEVQDLIDLALCRQETFHGRLRNFAILRNCFRHGKSTKDKMEIHETVSDAVLVITMYDLEYHPLFEVTSSPSEGKTQR
jgi:hypothetical protein